MNTTFNTLNASRLLSKQNLNNVDSEKFENLKNVLNSHQFKLLKKGDFARAEKAKLKVEELTKIEKERKHTELKQTCDEQRKEIDETYENDKEKINGEYDKKTTEILEKYKKLEQELDDKFKKEIEDYIKDFNKINKPQIVDIEISVMKKNLDFAIKQKNYIETKNLKMKLIDLEKCNKEKTQEKNKSLNQKLKGEISNLKKKHDEDFIVFQKKMDHQIEKCKLEKELGLAKALKRHKAKLKDLDVKNKKEVKEIAKPVIHNLNRSLIDLSHKYAKTHSVARMITTTRHNKSFL